MAKKIIVSKPKGDTSPLIGGLRLNDMMYNTFAKAHNLPSREYTVERSFILWAIDYYCLTLNDLKKISALILDLISEQV